MLQYGRGNVSDNVPALYASILSLVPGECFVYSIT